jgi:hypothetical protein
MILTHTSNRVLLVGSVPLGSAEEVFRTVIAVLGDCLRRVPDGETGDRRYWVAGQRPVFADHPDFEPVPAVAFLSGLQMPTITQFRVRDQVDPVVSGSAGSAQHAPPAEIWTASSRSSSSSHNLETTVTAGRRRR